MNTSYDVRLYAIRVRKDSKSNPYNVRWKVAGEVHTRVFPTMGLAKGLHKKLSGAMNDGEAFDRESGLPVRMAIAERERAAAEDAPAVPSLLTVAVEYVDYKWPRLSPNARRSAAEGLRDIALFMLPTPPASIGVDGLVKAMWQWLFNTRVRKEGKVAKDAWSDAPAELRRAVTWLSENAPLVTELDALETVRELLDALTWTRADRRASPTYFARRRQVLSNFLVYAVAKGHLTRNALVDPQLNWQKPSELKVNHTLDPRKVGAPEAVRRMLTAVSYVGAEQGPRFVALFAVMYFAMLRPEEAINVLEPDCTLPAEGWGRLIVAEAAAAPGRLWTDDGQVHDVRPLKHRSAGTVREVSIPPELVRILRAHIDRFGVAPDGRLFRSAYLNKYLLPSTVRSVWAKARDWGLTPVERRRGLLRYPALLRKAGISMRRTAGLPAREVADEAGHSVEVQDRVYSVRLSGFESRWQTQMDAVLNDPATLGEAGNGTRPQVVHSEPPNPA